MTSPVPVDRGLGGAWQSWRLVRRMAQAAVVVSALTGALAATAASPAAAADCPNAAYRIGTSANLPDCRAYELVSPPDKGANTLLLNRLNGNTPSYPAASGDEVTFAVLTPLPGSISGRPNNYVADRTPSGWLTHSVTPADCAEDASGIYTQITHILVGWSRDFSQAIISDGQNCSDPRDQAGRDVYLRQADGSLTWLSQNGQIKTDDVDATYVGSSADAGHILFTTPEKLIPAIDGDRLPGTPPFSTYSGLYDSTGGQLIEVGVGDDGNAINRCGAALSAPSETGQPVSSDGRVVFFTPAYSATEPDCDYAHGGGQLYARIDNRTTIEISQSRLDPTAVPTGVVHFMGATEDGAHVFFTSPDQLTGDAAAVDGGLYEYDLSGVRSGASSTGSLTFVIPGPTAPYKDIRAVPAISTDGAIAYVVVNGALPAGGDPNTANVYRLDHGHMRFVASSTSLLLGSAGLSASPDLSKLVYLHDPGDGNGQIQLYDADRPSAGVTCVSCPPAGVTATAAAQLRGVVGQPRPVALGRPTFVTDSGEVFFTSPDRLSDRDANDVYDVYAYDNGVRTLLSTGTGSSDSLLLGTGGPGGRDVFFATNDSLVASDTDNGDMDVYDARVGGGFAQPAAPVACRGASCHGPVPAPPALPAAATISFAGMGNVPSASSAGTQKASRVRTGKRRAVRGSAFRLKVRVPSAGRITVVGRGVRRAKRSARHRATYRVRVALTKRARRALARRHVLHLRLRVAFKPRHGKASSAVVRVTVRRPARHRSGAGRMAAQRPHRPAHRLATAKGGR